MKIKVENFGAKNRGSKLRGAFECVEPTSSHRLDPSVQLDSLPLPSK
jgi:hypothetical protein